MKKTLIGKEHLSDFKLKDQCNQIERVVCGKLNLLTAVFTLKIIKVDIKQCQIIWRSSFVLL